MRLLTFTFLVLFPLHLGAVDFNRDIRPILSDKCFACHGFDEEERKADLRLDTKEGAFADLGGYAALVPGKLNESEVWLRITTDDEDDHMPPAKSHKKLSEAEKKLIQQWISEGAKYEIHWAYQPLEKPRGKNIDSFIEARLKKKGLHLSPRADRPTLARRLYLDLLGLPPTPEQVAAFVKDTSPDAYDRLVDRLLADPAYGERMAVYWLDLVRYADTIGYHSDNPMEVSAYRDYVINAFNRNLSYRQFTIDQLAGDLLPNPTREQKVASAYNRLLQTTEEGGAQPAEYMVIYADDRVRNVSNVWLGSTMGCAQCHDHKYDPFSMKDFYSMAAFFADIKEKPVGKRVPNFKLPSAEESKRIAVLKKNLSQQTLPKIIAADAALAKQIAGEQAAWETEMKQKISSQASEWLVADPVKMVSTGRQTLKKLDDLSILASGGNPNQDNYRITLKGKGRVRGIRLEALTHQTMTNQSLSRANGNFVLTGVKVTQAGKPIAIDSARADYEQDGWPVTGAIDGKNNTGWAVNGHKTPRNHVAVFLFKEALNLGDAGEFTVELQHRSAHAKHNIGHFRLSTTESASPSLKGAIDLPPKVIEALHTSLPRRSSAQQKVLVEYYRTISPLLAGARKNLRDWKKELDDVEKKVQTLLISEALPTPQVTRVLNRGNWQDKKGSIVQPGVPAFLPRDKDANFATDRRANRLDLAKWIMGDSNPLTSRAFVNRIWYLLFGQGISRSLSDLGAQGKPPTHPELLNWLSVEFRESGWDVKHLIKLIVSSRCYQQVSTVTPELLKRDPGNLCWSRQGRWRIDAEFVRDSALSISGLLANKRGGRSVKPLQPAGYWQNLNFPKRKWVADKGDDLHRRSLYTFWCRSFPHPDMVAFDAPSREECTAQRARSNIPQQALVLLNDPVFVETYRAFGRKLATETGDSTRQKLIRAWRSATSRPPSAGELKILTKLFQSQKLRYQADQTAAAAWAGAVKSPTGPDDSLSELAAWTSVARALFNCYEVTSRF